MVSASLKTPWTARRSWCCLATSHRPTRTAKWTRTGAFESYRAFASLLTICDQVVIDACRLYHSTRRLREEAKPEQPKVTGGRRFLVRAYTKLIQIILRVLLSAIPYSSLTVGVPRETFPNERRVAITPQNTALLLKKGFARVLVERGAGSEAQFTDDAYVQAGATLVDTGAIWSESNILLKVRAPSNDGPNPEVSALREGGTFISFLYPAQNKALVEAISARKATAFAMDMIPRISRAQTFDALRCVQMLFRVPGCGFIALSSSMANIAGYKAVLEASNHFGRFLTGQVTAEGYVYGLSYYFLLYLTNIAAKFVEFV